MDQSAPQYKVGLKVLIKKVSNHGPMLAIVEQPASIGALPLAVAQDMGVAVRQRHRLAMRRTVVLNPSEAKTDAWDAAFVAETARTMPHHTL